MRAEETRLPALLKDEFPGHLLRRYSTARHQAALGKETETAGKQSNRSGKGKQLEYGAVGRGRVSRHKQFE